MSLVLRFVLFIAAYSLSVAYALSLPFVCKEPCPGSPPYANIRRSSSVEEGGIVDAGIAIGTAHALTDIGGTGVHSRDLLLEAQPGAIGLQLGAYFRYQFSEIWALKLAMTHARIGAADSLSHPLSGRFGRGYHFRNNLFEAALQTELHIPENWINIRPDVYLFTGFVLLFHEPRLHSALSPIDITAVRSPVPVIPFGLGIHYTMRNNLRLGFELGMRVTFFDYLDGYAPIQGPNKDSYFFNSFTIGYVFGPRRNL